LLDSLLQEKIMSPCLLLFGPEQSLDLLFVVLGETPLSLAKGRQHIQ